MGFDMDYDGALGFYDKSILLEGAPRLDAKDLSQSQIETSSISAGIDVDRAAKGFAGHPFIKGFDGDRR